jgi:enoyl-CoA hydratase/carnithine racemase
MLLTGKPITASRALQIGLVNEVLSNKEIMPRAIELAKQFVNSSSIAIKSILQATIAGSDMNIDAGLNLEAELFGNLCISEDTKEGIKAFINKRQPNFNKK